MFGTKEQHEEPALQLLQKGIERDRLRLKQRLELASSGSRPDETKDSRISGRLYDVFVALGEA
jgi:hypothetical protein